MAETKKTVSDEEETVELKAESDRVEAEKLAKAEAKKQEREAKKDTPESEQVYTKAQVQAMLKQLAVDIKSQDGTTVDDDEDYKNKKVRLARFQNKFIIDFKNTNTDEYYPELVIHAFDVWNEQTKRNDPWVTLIFDDASELNVPLNTVITKSTKVSVDLLDIIQKDTSYIAGKVERVQVSGNEYNKSGTGVMVKQKVTQAEYTYKVRLPDGREFVVGKDVINW